MQTFSLYTHYKKILADTITPVSIYLKIRDKYPNSILLESSDYHGNDNSFSYICCNPIASIKVKNEVITETFPDKSQVSQPIDGHTNVAEILQLIKSKNFAAFNFSTDGETASNLTDNEYKEQVTLAKKHCARGDVFQLVLSKKFSQQFKGDEFNVYRALRSINPSPYLFYFDYGDFKIFGSSPEAQLVIKKDKAEIHPIAGTFKRTGDDEKDAELAKQLAVDDKENAEHVMLVDLARNDLSRNGSEVTVEKYREVQFFSHVIHLVSKVVGKKNKDTTTMQMVADTFPAGTLSGAPKFKAMQLIEKYEKTSRDFYGGAIGFMDFEGNFNHAIMIRTFLSKNHHLHWQAGAGIVSKSKPEDELQEVYNKLGALTKAIEMAEDI